MQQSFLLSLKGYGKDNTCQTEQDFKPFTAKLLDEEATSNVEQKHEAKKSKFSPIKFTWRMIRWHILYFLTIFSVLYATFYYGFDHKHKKEILTALEFCDDWKQFAFFLGIYLSFAVKKVGDVTSVSNTEYC